MKVLRFANSGRGVFLFWMCQEQPWVGNESGSVRASKRVERRKGNWETTWVTNTLTRSC